MLLCVCVCVCVCVTTNSIGTLIKLPTKISHIIIFIPLHSEFISTSIRTIGLLTDDRQTTKLLYPSVYAASVSYCEIVIAINTNSVSYLEIRSYMYFCNYLAVRGVIVVKRNQVAHEYANYLSNINGQFLKIIISIFLSRFWT